MTTPESAAPEAATPDEAAQDEAAQDEARRKMQGYFPRCPSREHFPVITGFITPDQTPPDCHPSMRASRWTYTTPRRSSAPGSSSGSGS